MLNPQNSPYQQIADAHRSYSHYELHNAPSSHPIINPHPSQYHNNNMSAPISRTRIHSFQQHSHQNSSIDPRHHTESILKKREQKLFKYRQSNYLSKHQPSLSSSTCNNNHNNNRHSMFKESNGIMNQPPDYILNKYTFKNEEEQLIKREGGTKECGVFGSCCAMIKQTQKEVFLSPTQLITMRYFAPVYKQEAKSLKINNLNKSSVGVNKSHQQNKSFFKENNY